MRTSWAVQPSRHVKHYQLKAFGRRVGPAPCGIVLKTNSPNGTPRWANVTCRYCKSRRVFT
jgi:hypothetical protein